jgi:protein subunit release factor B
MTGDESTQQWPTDLESLERDTEMEFVKASGPGGQHRNKRETGVRLVHRPSGITVTAVERRSQAMNRSVAFERLQTLLIELQRPEIERVPTAPSRAAKRERLDDKGRHSAKKSSRRTRPSPSDND